MTRISDMTPLTTLPATGAYVPVEKTGSPINYRYDLSALASLNGLLVNAPSITIPTGVDIVSTTGADVLDHGGANYVAGTAPTARSGFISANSRNFVLSKEQVITPQQFYQATDSSFAPSMQAALDYVRAIATTGYGYGDRGSTKIVLPQNSIPYDFAATTFDLDFGAIIEGESVGGIGPGSTVLKWNAGTTGFRTQKGNTTGATGVKTPVSNSGIALFRNLVLHGNYSGGSESEAHGFHLRETAFFENVAVYNFPGDGIYCFGSGGSGAPTEGAPNECNFSNVFVQGCRNGFLFDGDDTNAVSLLGCKATANRMWGFNDSSFLGNYFFACRSSLNGRDGSSTPTACTFGGNRYFVILGQAVGASTNAPSGTTADNTWWGYIGAGGVTAGCVAWISGTTFREGGGYKTDNANQHSGFFGCYTESNENPPQISTPSIAYGGVVGAANRGTGPRIDASGPDLALAQGIGMQGAISSFGSASGSDLSVRAIAGSGGRTQVSNYWEIFVGGSRVHYTDSTGINLDSGKVVKVNSAQVVGARQTGTPADATDLATALTLVNALKAKLITHGLIS